MNTRSVIGLSLILAVSAALSAASVAGQWQAPRTADGHPDLQGNWNNSTITPFQRAEGQEPVFSQAEVERLEGRAETSVTRGSQASDPNRPPLEVGGDVGSYNDVYFERGMRVAVVNGEPRASILTRPLNGRRPPLTPAGQQRLQDLRDFRSQFGDADHPEIRSLNDRCLMFGSNASVPMAPNGAYNNYYTIVQTADHVMIHVEVVHDTRVIPLRETAPPPAHVTQWGGYSWGRWEGETLVVETTNVYPVHAFRGIPPTEDLKVTERFTRVDDDTILYQFTIEDPTTYAEPWGGEYPFNRTDDLLYEYNCHEGNYAMEGILRGARYQESLAGN